MTTRFRLTIRTAIAMLASSLVMAACRDSSGPPSPFVGSWTLASSSGRQVPYVESSGEFGITSGSLTIDSKMNWQFEISLCVRSTQGNCTATHATATGTWRQESDTVAQLDMTDGSVVHDGAATRRGSTLHFDIFEFRK